MPIDMALKMNACKLDRLACLEETLPVQEPRPRIISDEAYCNNITRIGASRYHVSPDRIDKVRRAIPGASHNRKRMLGKKKVTMGAYHLHEKTTYSVKVERMLHYQH